MSARLGSRVVKWRNAFALASALGKVVSGLITISLAPLKLAFYGISLAIDEAKLAWEESFFGDGDPKVIADLNKRISVTKDNIVEVGKSTVEAGKKVVNNFVDAVKEVSAVVEGTIDGVSKISIKGAYEQAKANVQMQNNAKLAAAEQARLVEQYDRQAEKLRQIRDNDLISIDDRIKANDDLQKVLEKQQQAMIAQANLQVQAAQATYNQNKTIENQVAVTEALANKQGVLAQVEGLRSEQIANSISLQKEKIALGQSEQEGLNALAIEQKKFNEEFETDESKKLELQRINLEEEKRIELERLQSKIDAAVQGTQARVDAELEYKTKKQEIDNALTVNADAKSKLRIKLLQAEKAAQIAQAGAIANALDGLSKLAGEKTAAGKALAIASATINTYKGISEVWGAASMGNPVVDMAVKIASTAIVAAQGIANVQKIMSVEVPESSGGSGSGPSAPVAQAPNFNVVGASSTSQLAQTIGEQQNTPVKAYVVSNDVTTAQALDRNIVQSASL